MSLARKVLVIDDFDRMSNKQQEESYKIFSLLSGKLPIVFVGDIEKVHLKDNNFLSKIIDRRIELPFVLHPSNIWQDYFDLLGKKFSTRLSDDFGEGSALKIETCEIEIILMTMSIKNSFQGETRTCSGGTATLDYLYLPFLS